MRIITHHSAATDDLQVLYRRAYRASNWPSTVEGVDRSTIQGWEQNRTIYCARTDRLIGAVQVKDDWIKRLAVAPERRQNGYGQALLDHAEAVVAQQYNQAVLRANDEIDWLVDWYEQNGYRVLEHQDRPDYPFDTVKMQKDLTT